MEVKFKSELTPYLRVRGMSDLYKDQLLGHSDDKITFIAPDNILVGQACLLEQDFPWGLYKVVKVAVHEAIHEIGDWRPEERLYPMIYVSPVDDLVDKMYLFLGEGKPILTNFEE